jgi:hypothetical protein
MVTIGTTRIADLRRRAADFGRLSRDEHDPPMRAQFEALKMRFDEEADLRLLQLREAA